MIFFQQHCTWNIDMFLWFLFLHLLPILIFFQIYYLVRKINFLGPFFLVLCALNFISSRALSRMPHTKKGKKYILTLLHFYIFTFLRFYIFTFLRFDGKFFCWGTLVSVIWQTLIPSQTMGLGFISQSFHNIHPPICRITALICWLLKQIQSQQNVISPKNYLFTFIQGQLLLCYLKLW